MAEQAKVSVSNSNSTALAEIPERFSPGELAPADGQRADSGFDSESLPEQYQNCFRTICQKIAQRDMYARIEEVKRAAMGRFYWRSMFEVYFNDNNAVWVNPTGLDGNTSDAGDTPLSYQFNIYQSYGRAFISKVGVIPNVRFEAFGENPNALRIAASADAMRRKIEAQNGTDVFAEDVARLFWTDGRVGLYSRWLCDGARFGYADEAQVDESPEGLGEGGNAPKKSPRQPKGGEVITPYGVLELKLPINMRKKCDFPYLQLAYEIDITQAKAMYPNIADKIVGGEPGPGEYNFDRTTRIACTQGIRLITQTGDNVELLPTYQQTWLRPSMFAEIDSEEDRTFFEENFPDGARVVFIGDTYAESRNENLDDHWTIAYPIPGDGQTTPSCGYQVRGAQDALNDLMDLRMASYMKSIPAMYGDKNVFDFQAFAKQKAGPGAHYPVKSVPDGKPLSNFVFMEPASNLPEDAIQFSQELFTDTPQALTGLFPAAIGSADPNNETKGGILALRDASQGQQGISWKAFRRAYCESLEQLVRIGAYYRASEAEDGSIKIASPGAKDMVVDLEDLRDGNYRCVPNSDQNYPNTFEDQQAQFKNIIIAAGTGTQQAQLILSDSKNAILFKKYLGIPDLIIPGADSAEKQLNEIEQLVAEVPIPTPVAMKYKLIQALAPAMNQPVPPPPPPEQMLKPSVDIDPQVDKHEEEAQACQDWLISPEGQRNKAENADGYMNVRLHYLLHKQQITQAQQQAMQMQVQAETMKAAIKAKAKPAKSPTESIAFKDMGPQGQLQIAAQAGLDISQDIQPSLPEPTQDQ